MLRMVGRLDDVWIVLNRGKGDEVISIACL